MCTSISLKDIPVFPYSAEVNIGSYFSRSPAGTTYDRVMGSHTACGPAVIAGDPASPSSHVVSTNSGRLNGAAALAFTGR